VSRPTQTLPLGSSPLDQPKVLNLSKFPSAGSKWWSNAGSGPLSSSVEIAEPQSPIHFRPRESAKIMKTKSGERSDVSGSAPGRSGE
jgi:hypothetical protein